jgi:N6-adenosine-specific RNA methylase IME4
VKTNLSDGAPALEDLKDDQVHFGMSKVTRLGTEFVLIGRRGNPFRLNNDVRQVVVAPVGEHSEKPEEVRRRIERLYRGPYLELFGR